MAGQQRITGIFPQIGPLAKDCNNTTNAACDIPIKEGCEARYYPDRCNYPVNASQMNAIISEIANVIKDAGIDYDCSKLDNLADAIQVLIENNLYGCLPYSFPTAPTNLCSLRNIAVGTIDGCSKLYAVPSEGNVIDFFGASSIYPANTSIIFSDTMNIYTNKELVADIRNNSVDWNRLNLSRIGAKTITRSCAGSLRIEVQQAVNFSSEFERRAICVVAINKVISLYPYQDLVNNLDVVLTENQTFRASKTYQFNTGDNLVEVFWVNFDSIGIPRIGVLTSSGNTDLTSTIAIYQQ